MLISVIEHLQEDIKYQKSWKLQPYCHINNYGIHNILDPVWMMSWLMFHSHHASSINIFPNRRLTAVPSDLALSARRCSLNLTSTLYNDVVRAACTSSYKAILRFVDLILGVSISSYHQYDSSTAQGGGGSFKIGAV